MRGRKQIGYGRASRPRKVAGVMNGTEKEYADRLAILKAAGKIADYWYECMTLKIGSDCRLTVDFLVMLPDGELELHECKGSFIRDDALVKLKAAADKFPLRFYLCVRQTKKQGGGWKVEEVKSDVWKEAA